MRYKHIFGPVLSRRLGISLGVDLVVHKVCSMDCVYCECGKTTNLTLDRTLVVEPAAVMEELDHFWANNDDPDYITFFGSGEPTLNSGLGKVIDHIKRKKPGIRVAVLTNSSLINDPDVRAALMKADRVIPSLDAARKAAFEKINRPHPGLEIEAVISGLEAFSARYEGELFLEVLILPGLNDTPEDLDALKSAVNRIRPDRVQINTLDRPGTCSDIRPASKEELDAVIRALGWPDTEIIAKVDNAVQSQLKGLDLRHAILETIHRRPCTVQDLCQTTGAGKEDIEACIRGLVDEKRVIGHERERGIFYQTVKELQEK